ncbi:hypothetical protein BH23ACI1_BH23ACI1_15800 [soil metagenome]|nr:hypothetical protein [Acidobacteriota bacterium]
MRLPLRLGLTPALLFVLSPIAPVGAQGPAATHYEAVTDRGARAKPALPAPGIAGSSFIDPAFGTRVWRISDAATRPARPDRSYRTPSGSHQNAWSLSGRDFFVVSTDGTVVPFSFDPQTGRASRIAPSPSDEGGLVLRFYIEPHFSYRHDGVIYGAASGGSLRTIDQYNFATAAYTRLIDLDTVAGGLAGTYVGGIGSSAGPSERLMTFFGGSSQDRHFYLLVFDPANPSSRRLLNTRTSSLDGRSTNLRLDFLLHAAAIDRSGRYVTLYPTSADRAAPRQAAPNYLWDLATDVFTELPGIAARSNGHDAYGYGVRVNQDCCTSTSWDAAQWQVRALASPLVTRDVISPVLSPRQVYLADHPSWHNARPDVWTPFISALYRYGGNTVEWRAWDDEIVAVQTGDPGGEVWRLAHHRSDVRHDTDSSRISFWYTPRPNVSPDGRWVLFTSNWEKTLGNDPGGDQGGGARQDVFLLRLNTSGVTPVPGPDPIATVAITTSTLPDARVRRVYSARLSATGISGEPNWRVATGALPPGIVLHPRTGALGGAPREAGTFTFTVAVAGASRTFSLTVR